MGKKRIHADANGEEFTYEDEKFVVHVRRPSHVGKQQMKDFVNEAIARNLLHHRLDAPIQQAKFTVRKPPLQGDRAKNAG